MPSSRRWYTKNITTALAPHRAPAQYEGQCEAGGLREPRRTIAGRSISFGHNPYAALGNHSRLLLPIIELYPQLHCELVLLVGS